MCGRYSLLTPSEEVAAQLGVLHPVPFPPRYDVRPGSEVPVVVQTRKGRSLQAFHWGLIPPWSEDPDRSGYKMINARSESVASKPAFRNAFRQRRCLIPADGFYEWSGPKGSRERHWIFLEGRQLFSMAGIWEVWRGEDGSKRFSCAILTTEPNELIGPLHDRMPAILDRREWNFWLSSDTPIDRAHGMLRPFPAVGMDTRTVCGDLVDILPEGWVE